MKKLITLGLIAVLLFGVSSTTDSASIRRPSADYLYYYGTQLIMRVSGTPYVRIYDDVQLRFGDDDDVTVEYDTASGTLNFGGDAVNFTGGIELSTLELESLELTGNATDTLNLSGGGDITGVDRFTGITVEVTTAIEMPDDGKIGFTTDFNNSGYIEFDDQSPDEFNIKNARLGIGVDSPDCGLHIGDGTISHALDEDSLFVSNKLEVDGIAYFDAGFYSNDIQMNVGRYIGLGVIATKGGILGSTGQTNDTPYLATGTNANSWLLGEYGDKGYDFTHAQQTNPTLFVHSANQSTTEWISITHDQTDGVIDIGTGNVKVTDTLEVNGAVDIGQEMIDIVQNDADEPVIKFDASTTATQATTISTVNGDGTVEGPKNFNTSAGWQFEGMIMIDVNGVDMWIPYYSADVD